MPLFFIGIQEAFFGGPATAAPILEDVVEKQRSEGDCDIGLPMALIVLGLTHLQRGAPQAALDVLDQASSLCEERGEDWTRSYAEFNAKLAVGDPAGAELSALCVLKAKVSLQDTLGILLACDELAGTAVALGRPQRAARLFGIARRQADDHGIGYDQLQAVRTASEPQAQAQLGDALYRAAHHEGMELDLEQAIAYALEETRSGKALLTSREEEVAALVAQGLTNRQIAERLTISKRTVDTHIEHAKAKLGFTTRTQIAAWHADRHHVG